MAKISRVLYKLFGGSGTTNDFGKFGSQEAGSAVKTKDLATIQSLTAWDNGWADAINAANKAPFLEDLNALFLVLSSGLKYLCQEGIPEYMATETYYAYSIVKKTGTAELYMSRTDDNVGNALPTYPATTTYWKSLMDLQSIIPADASVIAAKIGAGAIIPSKITNILGATTPLTSETIYQATKDTYVWTWVANYTAPGELSVHAELGDTSPPAIGVGHFRINSASAGDAGGFGFYVKKNQYYTVHMAHGYFKNAYAQEIGE
jgi:hypothetical protein